MNNYKRNKARAVFINDEPSMTDQSQARDTDINVIVKRYAQTGTAPGAATDPMFEDFSELPTDLRSMIEQTRGVVELRRRLPPRLAEMPVAQLLSLTEQQLTEILKPAEPTPKPTEGAN